MGAEYMGSPRSLDHEDQNHRTPRAQILRMDRWIHLGFAFYFPTDVDLEAGVRRIWTFHRPQKMLLNSLDADSFFCFYFHTFLFCFLPLQFSTLQFCNIP